MKKKLKIIIVLIVCSNFLFSQECTGLKWRTGERLNQDDFCIKIGNNKNSSGFAQFNLGYHPPAFGLFSKNFNKNVTNILIRDASWIDTASNSIKETIRYQQILFDMAEVYCRKFRMQLLKEKNKVSLDVKYIEKINSEILKEFSTKRAEFEIEYADGEDEGVKVKWEEWIKIELEKMSQFDYDNSKKIKLK